MWDPEPLALEGLPSSLVHVAHPQAAPEALTWLETRDIDTVLVLTRPDTIGAARYLSTVMVGARPDLRLSVTAPGTGKLASLVLGTRALGLGVGPAETLAALSITAASVTSGIWIRSLTRLKSPSPTMRQYLGSLVSRRGNVVTFTPDAMVRDRQWRPPTPAPSGSQLLVATNGEVPQTLVDTFPQLPVSAIPSAEDNKAYGARAMEFLIHEPFLGRPTPSGAVCPVCQDLLFGPSCPFCHIVSRPQGVSA